MIVKQVLVFYHLKIRHCANTVNITIFAKSCDKGFITKDYIVMNKHLNFTGFTLKHISNKTF